jgi:hypothetical protein
MGGDTLAEVVVLTILALVGLLISLTAILAWNWRRVRQFETEAALKQEMIQRGWNSDDIERVLRASASEGPATCALPGGERQNPCRAGRVVGASGTPSVR